MGWVSFTFENILGAFASFYRNYYRGRYSRSLLAWNVLNAYSWIFRLSGLLGDLRDYKGLV